MSEPDEDLSLERLRRLAVERPREARALFDRLLDNNSTGLKALLTEISSPAESRLRQVIANSIRAVPRRRNTVPQLQEWLHTETDEFTKNALRAALAPMISSATVRDPRPVNPAYVEAYRYAAGRLMHRVRNALAEPQALLLKLRRSLDTISAEQVRAELDRLAHDLGASFGKVGRIVEFDTDERYFTLRSMALLDWLQAMNATYAGRFEPVELKIDAPIETVGVRVMASDYLLETVFWNLWVNAQQSVSERCQISVIAKSDASALRIVLIDNGDGFAPEARESAFAMRYSTKGTSRGRGLLEVQDAMEQLRGDVHLVSYVDGTFRV